MGTSLKRKLTKRESALSDKDMPDVTSVKHGRNRSENISRVMRSEASLGAEAASLFDFNSIDFPTKSRQRLSESELAEASCVALDRPACSVS